MYFNYDVLDGYSSYCLDDKMDGKGKIFYVNLHCVCIQGLDDCKVVQDSFVYAVLISSMADSFGEDIGIKVRHYDEIILIVGKNVFLVYISIKGNFANYSSC